MRRISSRSALWIGILFSFTPQGLTAERPLTGSLQTVGGISVLTLTGSARENGYTRGCLLATQISSGLKQISSVFPRLQKLDFDTISKVALRRLNRPKEYTEELEGMLEGMSTKLGDDVVTLPGLGRKLTADDLWVLMSLADINCSSFAAWGSMTSDGGLIVGRNGDYSGKSAFGGGMVLCVHKSSDPRIKSWVDPITAMSLGVGTGINEDGLFIAGLDAPATGRTDQLGNDRWAVMRGFVEATVLSGNDDLGSVAGDYLRKNPIMRGGNFMVCAPRPAACVLECDANMKLTDGVTIRRAEEGRDYLVVTNHYRVRAASISCNRYAALDSALSAAVGSKKLASLQDGWDVITKAANGNTILTLVYRTSDRHFLISFTDGVSGAGKLKPAEFSLDELLGKR